MPKTHIRFGLFGTNSDIIKLSSDSFQKNSNMYKSLYLKKFGKLLVVDDLGMVEDDVYNREHLVVCRCDCGNIEIVKAKYLLNGHKKSCGCLHNQKINMGNLKHNLSYTRLYSIYYGMRKRCYKKSQKGYKNYGYRGIKVCGEWMRKGEGFLNFYNWAIKNGYSDDLTLDRKDVNYDYCPENCKWSTNREQANNKTTTIYLTYNNKTYSIAEWASIINVNRNTLYGRYIRGWDVNRIFEQPFRKSSTKK